MLIQGHKRFRAEAFNGLEELRDFLADHREMLLGRPTILLGAQDLKEAGCFERVPDFVALDVGNRNWEVVVIEPKGLVPESTAFRSLLKLEQTGRRAGTRKALVDLIVGQVKSKAGVLRSFEAAGVHAIDVREILGEIFSRDPLFDLIAEDPLDEATEALVQAAPWFRVWGVRKFVQESVPENVIYSVPEAPWSSGAAKGRAWERPEAQVEPRPPAAVEPASPGITVTGGVSERVRSLLGAAAAPERAEAPKETPKEASMRRAAANRRIGFSSASPSEPAFLQAGPEDTDVSLADLLGRGYLKAGDVLSKRYRWATGEVSQFEGTVGTDGSFHVQEVEHPESGGEGLSEDGLWRTRDGVTLADLKQRLMREPAPKPRAS